MKLKFNHFRQSIVFSGSIFLAGMTLVYATETLHETITAQHFPLKDMPGYHEHSKLSAEKMLNIADKFATNQQTWEQQKLGLALIYSAAKKGHAEAQFRLAKYYIEDELLDADEDQANYWLELAMAQNHQAAKFIYASLHEQYFDIGC